MPSDSLREYLGRLERLGALKRVSAPVDPELEITEIVHRLYRDGAEAPALLFENVRGSNFPLAINLLGSGRNIEALLGRPPEALGEDVAQAVSRLKRAAPEGRLLSWAWQHRGLILRGRGARTLRVAGAERGRLVQEGPAADLTRFPVMKCWPLDGGKFITAGLVFTRSPSTGEKNCGIYRLQVLSRNEVALHWQIQKGGGFHFWEAENLGRPLDVAVAIGSDPLLWLAGILPLPEGMDELAFAGFLKGRPVPVVRCRTSGLEVPASAEIVIEGVARPGRRAEEGPFGDHFGHYSHKAPFPVLEVACVTHKRGAIYHSAVVGKPPQEDKAMGEAVSRMFLPFLRMVKPELQDLWAYPEAGFHNLLVAGVKQRYEKEGVKTALGLLGEGQLSLSKCVILVDSPVPARDFYAVLEAIRRHFDPERDFILLPGTSQDTLDFTGPRINRGSKMILDATGFGAGAPPRAPVSGDLGLSRADERILDWRNLGGTLLAVQISTREGSGRERGKEVLNALLARKESGNFKVLAVVSEDVPLNDDALLLWGIFSRFDCESDLRFSEAYLDGVRPVHKGAMGIDATWKAGYPPPVEMDPQVAARVSARWKEYGF